MIDGKIFGRDGEIKDPVAARAETDIELREQLAELPDSPRRRRNWSSGRKSVPGNFSRIPHRSAWCARISEMLL